MLQTTHTANPVRVNAAAILEVTDQPNGNKTLRLSDGRNYAADSSMMVRYCPVVGDYLVTQEDGYEYLNPKDVFERKYSAGGPKSLIVITVQDTDNGAVVSLAAEPPMDMSAAPVGEAQQLVHLMLGALPMSAPKDAPRSDVELLNAMSGVLDKAAALTAEMGATPAGEAAPAQTEKDPGVQFPM
jgi:hypothetical protein